MTRTRRSTGCRTTFVARVRRWAGRRSDDRGQTALVAVLALTVTIALTGGVLISTVVQSSPLQQAQSVQLYSFRALQAGVNAYLTAINTNPGLAQCNTSTNGTGTCGGLNYGSWNSVDNSSASGADAEYYAFGNPQPTFDPTTGALTALQVQVVGAAYDATTPHKYVFQSESLSVSPSNGFLDHVWWSNYESYNGTGNYSGCTYNWKDGYNVLSGNMNCSPVYFGPGDYLNGPVYTNDSVFVSGGPNFGTAAAPSTVETADPHCLFTTQYSNQGMDGSRSNCGSASASVGTYSASSAYGHAVEVPPQDDAQLGTIAAQNGCLYSGPTQISLSTDVNGHGQMNVISPDTPEKSVTVNGTNYTQDTNNIGANLNQCPNNGTAPLPPNGVVFVQNATAGQTQAWSNPFDDPMYTSATNLTSAPTSPTPGNPVTLTASVTSASSSLNTGASVKFTQTEKTCTTSWWWGTQCSTTYPVISGCDAKPLSTPVAVTPATTPATYKSTATCSFTESTNGTGGFTAHYSGNASVSGSQGNRGQSNTLTGAASYGPNAQVLPAGCNGCYYGQTQSPDAEGDAFVNGSLSGQLTIGTANNVIIDGNLTYKDCSWTNGPAGAAGSGTPSQSFCQYNKTSTNDVLGLIANNYVEVNHPVVPGRYGTTLLPSCTTPGALCDAADGSGNLTIDAAVLALTQSFVVNNYATAGGGGAGGGEGYLYVYGSIQQYARGPVGTFSGSTTASGYTKHYTWDPLLDFVSPPDYLVPSMPSWVLASSSGNSVGSSVQSCPGILKPYGTTGTISTYCASGISGSGALPNYS